MEEVIPNEVTVLDPVYFINNSNDEVTISTKIGAPGQTAETSVTLTDANGNDKDLFDQFGGSIPTTPIGKNKDLDGCLLTITCFITVTADDTNFCEELITMNGGVNKQKYKLFQTLQKEGDSTIPPFSCIISFIKS